MVTVVLTLHPGATQLKLALRLENSLSQLLVVTEAESNSDQTTRGETTGDDSVAMAINSDSNSLVELELDSIQSLIIRSKACPPWRLWHSSGIRRFEKRNREEHLSAWLILISLIFRPEPRAN